MKGHTCAFGIPLTLRTNPKMFTKDDAVDICPQIARSVIDMCSTNLGTEIHAIAAQYPSSKLKKPIPGFRFHIRKKNRPNQIIDRDVL